MGQVSKPCWTVSCISLQSAGSLLLCQEYRRTARKCQRYSQKWLCTLSVISQIIIDFLKLLSIFDFLNKLNALLSLFLTAYHYSHRYQSQCHRRLPNLNVPYFEWHWMSSLDIYMSASNLKPSRFSSSGYPFRLLHLDFNQVLWHEGTVCPVYLPLFHSQYASHGHLLEEWF